MLVLSHVQMTWLCAIGKKNWQATLACHVAVKMGLQNEEEGKGRGQFDEVVVGLKAKRLWVLDMKSSWVILGQSFCFSPTLWNIGLNPVRVVAGKIGAGRSIIYVFCLELFIIIKRGGEGRKSRKGNGHLAPPVWLKTPTFRCRRALQALLSSSTSLSLLLSSLCFKKNPQIKTPVFFSVVAH